MNMLGISALGNFPSVSDTLGEVYNTVCFYFIFFFLQCTGLLKVSEASLGLESNIVEYLLGQKRQSCRMHYGIPVNSQAVIVFRKQLNLKGF